MPTASPGWLSRRAPLGSVRAHGARDHPLRGWQCVRCAAGGVPSSMLAPSHPGESILLGCLGEDLDAAGAAALLEIRQAVLDEVLAGRAPVTPDLARRMEDAGWSGASFWLPACAVSGGASRCDDRASDAPEPAIAGEPPTSPRSGVPCATSALEALTAGTPRHSDIGALPRAVEHGPAPQSRTD